MRRASGVLAALGAVALISIAGVAVLGLQGDDGHTAVPVPRIGEALHDAEARGAYLVTTANCRGCHTARGQAPYAGGREIPTPFGVFVAPNITPDEDTGIGDWSAEDFWFALHEGKRPDGAPLYPSFPYTHYTKLDRRDADAMYAYLRTVPAVAQAAPPHRLKFPYDQRWLLVAWRALFFRPGTYAVDPSHDDTWNRGAYLVQGLGHCGACHEARNALGAVVSRDNPAGGVVLSWYAPSLESRHEAGLSHWQDEDIVRLLRGGRTAGASTLGPMAEVVYDSLQHWQDADLHAMAAYLRQMPDRAPAAPGPSRVADPRAGERPGARLYAEHCASCHGQDGEGEGLQGPPLAGNRAVTMDSAVNPIRAVLYGGYAPGTADNPEPFGMPPFHAALDDRSIAEVLSFMRTSWGNTAAPVRDFEVTRQRTGPLW